MRIWPSIGEYDATGDELRRGHGQAPYHDMPIGWISAQAESLDRPMLSGGLPAEPSNEMWGQRPMSVDN
jgi:hypothetical protein